VAGQGTLVLEWLDQIPDLDMIVLPVGGAGLSSGVGLALKAMRPASHLSAWQPRARLLYTPTGTVTPSKRYRSRPTWLMASPAGSTRTRLRSRFARQVIDDFVLVNDDEIAAPWPTAMICTVRSSRAQPLSGWLPCSPADWSPPAVRWAS